MGYGYHLPRCVLLLHGRMGKRLPRPRCDVFQLQCIVCPFTLAPHGSAFAITFPGVTYPPTIEPSSLWAFWTTILSVFLSSFFIVQEMCMQTRRPLWFLIADAMYIELASAYWFIDWGEHNSAARTGHVLPAPHNKQPRPPTLLRERSCTAMHPVMLEPLTRCKTSGLTDHAGLLGLRPRCRYLTAHIRNHITCVPLLLYPECASYCCFLDAFDVACVTCVSNS